MFSIIIKPAAYQMLNEAYHWYEEQLPGLGERLLEEVEAGLAQLTANPRYYSYTHSVFRQMLLRRFPYKIVFEIIENDVIVYAIFHTSRNPDRIFE